MADLQHIGLSSITTQQKHTLHVGDVVIIGKSPPKRSLRYAWRSVSDGSDAEIRVRASASPSPFRFSFGSCIPDKCTALHHVGKIRCL